MNKRRNNNIFQKEFLRIIKELETLSIEYNGQKRKVISELKSLPRTGIEIRLEKFNIDLPVQSVYDHSMSLAYNADILINEYKGEKIDPAEMAYIFIFHDMSEIIMGDVPDFTDEELAGTEYKSKEGKVLAEQKANQIILKQLPHNLAKVFSRVINKSEENGVYKFFQMLDKTEPIISVWRYINIYKKEMDIDLFIKAMEDFFLNPNIEKRAINSELKEMVKLLQSKDKAKQYYKEGEKVFDLVGSEKVKQYLVNLIAAREIK